MVYEGVVKLLEQQGQQEDVQQQQHWQDVQQQQKRPALTDRMSPLVIAADTQAEQ
jgi:hypothetical protein